MSTAWFLTHCAVLRSPGGVSAPIPLPAVFSGVLTPGTYTIGAAAACDSAASLNCGNNPSAAFSFIIGGALSLNADVLTVNGACDVQWAVNGAVTIAAGVSVDGNIAATGAISLGANSQLIGTATAGGALTLGAGASVGAPSG